MIAHERNAAWLIELWLLIHGPDPAPIDLGGLGKDVRLLATVRAIAGLARCLGDVPAEQAILQALRPVVGRAGEQLREEF